MRMQRKPAFLTLARLCVCANAPLTMPRCGVHKPCTFPGCRYAVVPDRNERGRVPEASRERLTSPRRLVDWGKCTAKEDCPDWSSGQRLEMMGTWLHASSPKHHQKAWQPCSGQCPYGVKTGRQVFCSRIVPGLSAECSNGTSANRPTHWVPDKQWARILGNFSPRQAFSCHFPCFLAPDRWQPNTTWMVA